MTTYRTLFVTGGPNFDDATIVAFVLNRLRGRHGLRALHIGPAADNTERMVRWWARHTPVELLFDEQPADALLAFPGGMETAEHIRRAKAAGLPVLYAQVLYDDWRSKTQAGADALSAGSGGRRHVTTRTSHNAENCRTELRCVAQAKLRACRC